MKTVYLEFEKPIADLETRLTDLRERQDAKPGKVISAKISSAERKLEKLRRSTYDKLDPWQRVQISRHPNRLFTLDYIAGCFTDFIEIHGDRHIGDDAAMPCGFATLDGTKCVVIGHQKGRDTKESLKRNFGSGHPEGYRKALRAMRLAEKFSLPIITLIDTPGAYPGIEAEERNIAEAIAFNLREMMMIRTPIVAAVIGEGGSGGALGIGVADRVLIMENAYYSVISPEGCAAILWNDRKRAADAARALKLSSEDLSGLGIVDGVINEPEGGAHRDPEAAMALVGKGIKASLDEIVDEPLDALLEKRYQKFRNFGDFMA